MEPLLISQPEIPEWVSLVSQAADLLGGTIGFLIAYIAYRGYRRNDSRPMFFISLGFILAIGLPFAALLPLFVLPSVSETVATILVFLTDIGSVTGLACILYALWMPS